MAEQLYALKRDLDMLTESVQNMQKSYNLLDYIAKVVHDSELEQMAQAAQMRRMEEKLDDMNKEFQKKFEEIEEKFRKIEKKFEKIERTLFHITKHLGIKPA